MTRTMLGLVTTAVLAGIATAPGSAHSGHASCAAYGATVSENARADGPWGAIVSHGAQLGLTSALVAEAHTLEGLCEPR